MKEMLWPILFPWCHFALKENVHEEMPYLVSQMESLVLFICIIYSQHTVTQMGMIKESVLNLAG